MAGISFDSKVSLGHLITIGTVLISVGIGWANLDNRVTANEKKVSEQTILIKELSDEADLTRTTLAEIRVDVGYLRRWVEELRREERASID
jgi:uncharacterized coiled-coil protein SlyX